LIKLFIIIIIIIIISAAAGKITKYEMAEEI
jgi:hypothetical protein